MSNSESTTLVEREILATRLLEAPRELVFRVCTDTDHLAQWWGPSGFTTTTRRADIRPGGQWRFVMHGPDGTDYENLITFLEVDAPRRLVYRHGASAEVEPVDFRVEVAFVEQGAKTRLTMRMVFASTEARDRVIVKYGALEGLEETMERLRDHVLMQDAFVIARSFEAPLDLVWKVHTQLAHLEKWWGPKGFEMFSSTLDLRPGGVFHYGLRTPQGQEMWGRFVYREIIPMKRLTFVISFSDAQGGITRHPGSADWPLEVLNAVTFSATGGKTTLTYRAAPVNASESERRTFKEGYKSMEGGFSGTLDQLGEFLRSPDAGG